MSARSRTRRRILGTQAIALAGTWAVLATVLGPSAVAEPRGVGYSRNSDRDGYSDGSLHESPEVGGRVGLDPAGPDVDRNRDGVPDQWAGRGPAAPAKPASPSLDVGPKPREQSFYGVSGGWAGLRGTIGLSEDGRQLHLGAGIGRPGASIGAIDKAPDGLNANGKAGITISPGNKGSVKGKVNVSPDLDVSGSVGAEISVDLGNGYTLELGGTLAYKNGQWEFSTSTSRTVPIDKRREVTVGDDGKAKMKLPSKPSPWKAKPEVELDASITGNGTFDIGKALESLGVLDPAPARQPNSVGGPDERAKAPNSSGSPDDRGTRGTTAGRTGRASNSGTIGPADNPSNGGDRGSPSYAGRAPNSSGSPDDRDSRGGDRDSSSSSGSPGSDRSGSTSSTSRTSGPRSSSGAGNTGSGPSSSGKSGPADNPDNGGDRGSASYGSHHSSSYDGSPNSSGSPDDRDADNGNNGNTGSCACF